MKIKFIFALSFFVIANSVFAAYEGKKRLKIDVNYNGSAVITVEKDLEDYFYIARYKKVDGNDWKYSYETKFTISGAGLYELYINDNRGGIGEITVWEQKIYIPFPQPENAKELAMQYMPITIFHEDEEYFPQTLEKILSFREETETVELFEMGEDAITLNMGQELMGFMEFNGHSNAYFNFGHTESTCIKGMPYCWPLFLRDSTKDAPGFDISDSNVYWDASEENGKLYLTYYYFYSFDPKGGTSSNPGDAAHALDRESVTISFIKENNKYTPFSVTYAGHLEDQTIKFKGCDGDEHSECDSGRWEKLLDWKGGKATIDWEYINKVGKHPVIYKAKGAHAIYPTYGYYRVISNGVLFLTEPAGSVDSSQILFPSDDKLVKLDYSAMGFLSYSGFWVDVWVVDNAKFPPFIRTPYSTWINNQNYENGDETITFNDCLSGAEISDECQEVKNFFTELRGFNNYKAATIEVRDETTGEVISNATVSIKEANGSLIESGTTLSDGIRTLFFEQEEGISYYIEALLSGYEQVSCDPYNIMFASYPMPNNAAKLVCYLREAASEEINLESGLVGYYPFEENANNAIAGADNGVPSYSVGFGAGINGQAAVFRGIDAPGSIYIPNSPSLQFENEATYSAWVRVDKMGYMDGYGHGYTGKGGGAVFAKRHDRAGAGFQYHVSNTGKATSFIQTYEDWDVGASTYMSPEKEVGEWAYLTVTFSSESGTKIFIDGELWHSYSQPVNFERMNSEALYIGKFSDHWYPFMGTVDEFRIYNRVLNEDEIKFLYENPDYKTSVNDNNPLQGILNDITVDGDSSVNIEEDQIQNDGIWQHIAAGSIYTLIGEYSGYAEINSFGIYDGNQNRVELFSGANSAGDQALLIIKEDGSVYVNFHDSGVDFSGETFGFYLDSGAGETFYSESSLNNGDDHMLSFQGKGDQIQLPGYTPSIFSENEYVIAFEDMGLEEGDHDFTDAVIMIESLEPVAQ